MFHNRVEVIAFFNQANCQIQVSKVRFCSAFLRIYIISNVLHHKSNGFFARHTLNRVIYYPLCSKKVSTFFLVLKFTFFKNYFLGSPWTKKLLWFKETWENNLPKNHYYPKIIHKNCFHPNILPKISSMQKLVLPKILPKISFTQKSSPNNCFTQKYDLKLAISSTPKNQWKMFPKYYF